MVRVEKPCVLVRLQNLEIRILSPWGGNLRVKGIKSSN